MRVWTNQFASAQPSRLCLSSATTFSGPVATVGPGMSNWNIGNQKGVVPLEAEWHANTDVVHVVVLPVGPGAPPGSQAALA